jgi:hypothetical protein
LLVEDAAIELVETVVDNTEVGTMTH